MEHEERGRTEDTARDARAQRDRLLHTLDARDDLDHAQAEAVLPLFVQAEAAGEDVDFDPAFAALQAHLDGCARCTSLYAELAEDVAALADLSPAPAQPALAPPTFFGPTSVRQSERVTLRVWQGLARRIEALVAPVVLAPRAGTLGPGQQVTLFADRIAELPGNPLLSITLQLQAGTALVRVAVRDPRAATRWLVQLTSGDQSLERQTDAQGLAEFANVPLPDQTQLRVTCTEVIQSS